MNWHAVAVAGFWFIAFCALCSLMGALGAAERHRNRNAVRWIAIMLVLMAIDTFLAGLVWA